ncbi:unnamed protein product [Caenorhabditis auriculariae]|uniref:Prenyltransferase alpha-alpha toroid domain-containing protein n=1 Tax=Caenorhabditis auriculariae TaxID=2777116 RepID=A0A8S1HM26_9PELO|nr:unnamed protein product [Caenorhabditis auriculariae]
MSQPTTSVQVAAESLEKKLFFRKHVSFLARHLKVFPEAYNTLDTNRITLLFFALSSLDVIGELDELIDSNRRKEYIKWIYNLQISTGN